MFTDYQYAYFIGDLIIALPAWALIFYLRKDLRREMLIAGLMLGLLSVLTEPWYLRDYWQPEGMVRARIILGDFFFGFFPGAVACVVYEGVFGKHYTQRKNRAHHWRSFLLPLTAFGGLMFLLLVYADINSMYASSIALIALAVVMVFYRPDLLWDAVWSSLLFGTLATLGYLAMFHVIYPGIVESWWLSANASGTLVLGIPIEEIAFEFSLGMAMGPMYEFFAGSRFLKR
ncbi:MAG: lycopene cyclase domain-containing protein [Candidatus Paceibacterota bacterium]